MTQAGKILQNRYRIEKEIGQGGMGTVFVAVDERFGSTVAIKQTVFSDENLTKAFEREARLLNGLKHPALPKVTDHFVEENGQFIVMEFIPGEDLSEILEKRDEPFAVDEVLGWAEQLCDALDYLHNQEMPVIHRDIKPQNLKLTPDGRIILLDFGLAKGNPNDASHKTQAKSIFGFSRNYASLEQIQGTGTDPQSDLYSLGATLYHLMTGIPPADALTRAMNVLNAKSDPLIAAHLINPKIPEGLSNVLLRSMALNSNERPSTANELGLLLKNCDREVLTEFSPKPLIRPAELFSQETKIMSAESDTVHGSETRLMEPRVTHIPSVSAAKPSTRRRVFAAAAAVAITAAGVSIFYADVSLSENPPSPVQPVSLVAGQDWSGSDINPEAKSDPGNPRLDDSGQTQQRASEPIARSGEKTAPDAPDSAQTAKTTSAKPRKADKEEAMVIQSDEGTIRIYENRLETDEFILDESGIRPKLSGGIPPFGKIRLSREQIKALSAEERKKIAHVIEMQKQKVFDGSKKPPASPPTAPVIVGTPEIKAPSQ